MACTPLGTSCFPALEPEAGCKESANFAQALAAASARAVRPLMCPDATISAIVTTREPFVWPGMTETIVAVWMKRRRLVAQHPEGKDLSRKSTFGLELWMPGLPTPAYVGGPTGTDLIVPDDDVRNRAGRTSIIVAETWTYGLAGELASMPCTAWEIVNLEPISSADLLAWRCEITADVSAQGPVVVL